MPKLPGCQDLIAAAPVSSSDGDTNDIVIGILAWAGILAAAAAIWWACVTEITVPRAWPYGATLATLWLLVRGGRRRLTGRRTVRAGQPTISQPEPITAVQALTGSPDQRIGRRERDAVIDLLQRHYAAERLNESELDERFTTALHAKTRRDLGNALRDLPPLTTARRKP